jgi:hypothetical protein
MSAAISLMSGDSEKATEDYEVVKISDKPFSSLPLFLPNNLIYIEETNTVRPIGFFDEKDTSTSASTTGEEKERKKENDGLVIVPNAGLAMLQKLNQPIATISCIGPYRTGKSLLMSRFLQTSNAFDIGPTLEGCTRGIWISTSALKAVSKTKKGSGCFTFFLDAEGLGDPLQGDEASNARIAMTCILLSSVLVFNNTSHPDRSSLQFLRMLHTIRQKIPQHRHFPSLCWVFRDFFLQLPKRTTKGDGHGEIGTPYTLQEFMMERVLCKTDSSSMRHDPVEGEVIDSLLNDFSQLKVMSVGYPKKQDGFNMSPEEMSMLQDVDWNELDERFRNDMQDVIDHCLENAAPFQLGALGGTSTPSPVKEKRWNLLPQRTKSTGGMYATGVVYSKWCTTVISLVNSPDTVPNLPDLQQQLLQQMADDLLQSSLGKFEADLTDWWNNECPVFNGGNEIGEEIDILISQNESELKAVADAKELETKSQEIYNQLRQELYRGSISSVAILTATLKKLEQKCYKDPATSILAQIRQENTKRSQAACQALAKHLYTPLRSSIRVDPTCMSLDDFKATLQQLTESFKLQARGPAVDSTLVSHFSEPAKADSLLIEKVSETNVRYQEAVKLQEHLSKDVEEKGRKLKSLEDDLTKNKEEAIKAMEGLAKNYEAALAKVVADQHAKEEERWRKMQEEMAHKLQAAQQSLEEEQHARRYELEMTKVDAEQRLSAEVAAREERRLEEQQTYHAELASIQAKADNNMQSEMSKAEGQRMVAQEKLEAEMQQKLGESETKLQAEIKNRKEELLQSKRELEAKEKDRQELQEKIAETEERSKSPCSNMCCCM